MQFPHDVIVVLGHNALRDNPVMLLRVRRAVELQRAGAAPRLLMSGRWHFRHRASPLWETEAAVMREVTVEMGADPASVLLEEESTDTLTNAYFTKIRYLVPGGWRRVALVTSDYHIERARWAFERVLGPAFEVTPYAAASPYDAEGVRERLERNEHMRQTLERVLAGVKPGDDEALARLLKSHPGYTDDADAGARFFER